MSLSRSSRWRFRPGLEVLEARNLLSAGSLDTSFGVGGLVTTGLRGALSDTGSAVAAVQGDGKVVLAGSVNNGSFSDFALARYTGGGALDTKFGVGGLITTEFHDAGNNPVSSSIAAIGVQADGKIVVAGSANTNGGDFALARYTTRGLLDPSFGTAGRVTTDFANGSFDEALGLAIQRDGKIVVVGLTNSFGLTGQDFALARYNRDGSLDTSFGSGGLVTTDFQGQDDAAYGVVLQPDNKIVVVGSATTTVGGLDYGLARYLSNGTLDPTFGSGGKVTTDLQGGSDTAHAVVLQNDGSLLVAGSSVNHNDPSEDGYALVRYLKNGSIDTSYGTGGEALANVQVANESLPALALQPDGKAVLAATAIGAGSTTQEDFFVARYQANGSLDAGFGNGGTVLTDFYGGQDFGSAVALQGGGKIVVGGSAFNPAPQVTDFAVARYKNDGSLDASFGSGGKVTTDFVGTSDDLAAGVVVQPDGKTVVAGTADDFTGPTGPDFALVRYNADGSLDTSFGTGGKVFTDFGGSEDFAFGLVLQPDGKIVVAGVSSPTGGLSELALARYNTDGSLDTSFGSGGEVTTNFGGAVTFPGAVTLDANGRIVVVTTADDFAQGTGEDFLVARYNSNGSLDASFGSGGHVTTDFAGQNDEADAVAATPDGKIVVAGTVTDANGNSDFGLARYTANGSLDPTFGTGGLVTTNFGTAVNPNNPSVDAASGLAIQRDGKIIVVGSTNSFGTTGQDFAMARYNLDGSLDQAFGSGGLVTTDFGGNNDAAAAVTLTASGQIVVVGESVSPDGTTSDFAVVRYNANGSLDNSFGTGGEVLTSINGDPCRATAVALAPDGDIVVAGVSSSPLTGDDFALARYEEN
jgi:uncharacterized delta-60 repeat protein